MSTFGRRLQHAAAGHKPAGAGSGSVTHGFQITPTNTGHDAYYDPSLGRLVTDADLTVHTAVVYMSDIAVAGQTITRHDFQGGLVIDVDNLTFVACRSDRFSGYWSGTTHPFTANWCTVASAASDGGDGMNYNNYTAYRCRIGGSTDGAKINGNVTMTECYVRTMSQDSADHNDGLQNYAGSGNVTIVRCNIDCRPVNGGGGANCAIFSADGMTGTVTITDNYLMGGSYLLGLHENGYYIVNGNWGLAGSYAYGPVDATLATSVTWANQRPNYLVDSSGNKLSTIAAP